MPAFYFVSTDMPTVIDWLTQAALAVIATFPADALRLASLAAGIARSAR